MTPTAVQDIAVMVDTGLGFIGRLMMQLDGQEWKHIGFLFIHAVL